MAKEANTVDTAKQEKLKILQSTLDKIEKSYGKGSIMKLGDRPNEQLEVISTGSISLDMALGVGGFPPPLLMLSMLLIVFTPRDWV